MHPYFAGHGYAAVRVDIRGSGELDGLLSDEYAQQEQDDALEVIAWLAAQPWCSGAIGMMGISWGGFNALQVAARRPPALKAIITVCSTDDRYRDDVHYMGGTPLRANFGWASFLFGAMCHPPDPTLVGDRWRAMWLERLNHLPLFVEPWLRHQWRDAYWKHGSVCEDYSAIQCPVYAVGGWTDGYTNAIPPAARAPGGAAQGPHRPLGTCLSAFRAPRSTDRLSAGGAAVVGSLAEGYRHRPDGRADAASVDDGQRKARAVSRDTARAMGCRTILASANDIDPTPVPR